MSRTFGSMLTWGSSIVALTMTSAVFAQETVANPGSATSATAQSENGIADIVVTGEKRSNSVNRIGLTMSVLGADSIDKLGIANVRDLAKVVPGLFYTESPSSTPVYTLRGVGFYEVSLAGYPDVSVYVDQVPLPFPALTPQAALDLERIEVLKGPQGILFGQNATGGAINYIAAKPTDQLKAGVDLSYGRFDRIEASGFISGPISDTLRARAAVKIVNSDDWQYRFSPSSYGGSNHSGAAKEYVGRLLLDWTPTDRLSVGLNLNGWINKTDPQAAQFFNINIQNPTAVNAIARIRAVPFAPRNARAANWSNHLSADDWMYQLAATVNYELFDDVTLTSISSYARYDKDAVDTNDGLPFIDQAADQHDGQIKSFSQEVRLANGSANRFRWTAGANVERSNVYEIQHFSYADGTLPEAFGLVSNFFYSDQRMRNIAGFANGEFDIAPALTIKAGLRYTESSRRFTGCGYDDGDGRFASLFSVISSSVTGVPITLQPGDCFVLNANVVPGLFNDKLKENNLSWRIGADYRVDPRLLLYANIAKGFKAGGFPTLGASTTAQYAPVVQEELLDYEAGFKAQIFDRRLSVSGAAFYYEYKNKQVRTKLIDPIFGVIDALGNVPKSHVVGAELSVATSPISGLNLTGALTYLDAQVDRYIGVDLRSGTRQDFSNTPLPFAPKWQYALTSDYEVPIGDLTLGLGASLTHNGPTLAVVGNDYTRLRSYTLLDARIALSGSDDRWTVALWGKNLTNKYYWTNVVQIYDVSVRYAGQPATYGIRLSHRW